MIECLLSGDGQLSIHSQTIVLRGALPVIDDLPLDKWTCEVVQNDPLILWFRSPARPGVIFQVETARTGGGLALQMKILGMRKRSTASLGSFGLRFSAVENMRAYLKNGYHSWDGSYYVQPGSLPDAFVDRQEMETAYAVTQILPSSGVENLVLGFDRHDRFQQTFSFQTASSTSALTILTHWDQREESTGEVSSEWLHIFEGETVEDGLRRWAGLVAECAVPQPRVQSPLITGWCSWYNLYAAISEENILEHLRGATAAAAEHHLPMRVFQIDDGFTPEMGDWLEVKPQFPRGMKPVLDEIREAGFIPGLWIAPFLVGNRSKLCREHPDWLVRDRTTGGPLVLMRFYGEFRWHKRSEEYYLLDMTHPDAFAYLRGVFHTWRTDWGCGYFKTDFMYYGAKDGPATAEYHQPGLSRVEIWRKTAEMIREAIGDALWMGCGCPLWASVGLVDAVRIGRDVGTQWAGNQSAQSLLRDQATRNFANHILWQADPDSVLLRERHHNLSDVEIDSLAIYAGMSGGVTTTSDDLADLSERRMRLWKLILPENKTACRFPQLGQSPITYAMEPGRIDRVITRQQDPLVVQVRAAKQGSAVFILNTGEECVEREYRIRDFGLPEPAYAWEWGAYEGLPQPLHSLSVRLEPHAGKLVWLAVQPLEHRPENLF